MCVFWCVMRRRVRGGGGGEGGGGGGGGGRERERGGEGEREARAAQSQGTRLYLFSMAVAMTTTIGCCCHGFISLALCHLCRSLPYFPYLPLCSPCLFTLCLYLHLLVFSNLSFSPYLFLVSVFHALSHHNLSLKIFSNLI